MTQAGFDLFIANIAKIANIDRALEPFSANTGVA